MDLRELVCAAGLDTSMWLVKYRSVVILGRLPSDYVGSRLLIDPNLLKGSRADYYGHTIALLGLRSARLLVRDTYLVEGWLQLAWWSKAQACHLLRIRDNLVSDISYWLRLLS